MAKKTNPAAWPRPTAGGSYLRDPVTGQLTRQDDSAADAKPAAEAGGSQKPGEKESDT